jgi:hypothetical protein
MSETAFPASRHILGAILRPVPHAQDGHAVGPGHFIHDEIWDHGDKLARAGNAPDPATTREYGQAVTGKQ